MFRDLLTYLCLAVAVSLVCVGLTAPTSDLTTHSRWDELEDTYRAQQQLQADLVAFHHADRILQDLRYRAVLDLAHQTATRARSSARRAPASRGSGRYAIPAHIVMCESGGDYQAENPTSSASGAYQLIDSTFLSTNAGRNSGHTHASHAPPHVQDAAAVELWAGGRGRSHWAQCL